MIEERTAAVMPFVIQVEKRLCAILGRPWSAEGISVDSLLTELEARVAQPSGRVLNAIRNGEEPVSPPMTAALAQQPAPAADAVEIAVDAVRKGPYFVDIDDLGPFTIQDKVTAAVIEQAVRNIRAALSTMDSAKDGWVPTHRHWQGGLYQLLFEARDETNLQTMCVYRDEAGTNWVRSKIMWDDVLPDGRKRFEPLPAAPNGDKR